MMFPKFVANAYIIGVPSSNSSLMDFIPHSPMPLDDISMDIFWDLQGQEGENIEFLLLWVGSQKLLTLFLSTSVMMLPY